MGKLRNATLPAPTNWIKDGEWAKSLGYPIGNNLKPEKFWHKKLDEVNTCSQNWIALKRNTYAGRNLIVQSMYFEKIRYWLYNLPMNKSIKDKIQTGADQLWWSKDPDLDHPKRFRRFVAKETAIGPKSKGGLGMMDWHTHSEGFTSQWIINYVANPARAPWKTILDFFLFKDKKGNDTHPEGRAILFCKLTSHEKLKLLHRLPKKATYIRQCLKDFWSFKLTPAKEAHERPYIGSEPLWWNHDISLKINWRDRNYWREVLQVVLVSDLVDKNTNRLFKRSDWIHWIETLHLEKFGKEPDNVELMTRLDQATEICASIPNPIRIQLRKKFTHALLAKTEK